MFIPLVVLFTQYMRIICLLFIEIHRAAMATGSTRLDHDIGSEMDIMGQDMYNEVLAFWEYTEYAESNLRKAMARVQSEVGRLTGDQMDRTVAHLASLSVEQRNLLVKFDPRYQYLGLSIGDWMYREYVRMITGTKVMDEELEMGGFFRMSTITELLDACALRDEVFPTLNDLVPSTKVMFASACTRLAELASLNDVSMAHFVRELSNQDLKEGAPLLENIFGSLPLVADRHRVDIILKEPFKQLVLEAHVVAMDVDSRGGVILPSALDQLF